MKNKTFRNAFDSILPSEKQKQMMLSNILEQKKKTKQYKKLLWIPAVAFVCLIGFFLNQPNNNSPVITPVLFRGTTITYQNLCYQETFNPVEKVGIYLETMTDGILKGSDIYQGEEGNIIVYNNGIYTEFRKCQ